MASGLTTGYSRSFFEFVSLYATKTLSGSSTTISDPVGYLDLIRRSPPACVNTLSDVCGSLGNASKVCWSESFPPGPQGCYCQALSRTNCSSLCASTAGDRLTYYQWVMGTCSSNATFSRVWPEMQVRLTSIYEDLIPWEINLQPLNNTGDHLICPSNSTKIASFAVINILVCLASLVPGRRTIVHRMTFGLCGKEGSSLWPLISLLVVVFNILANLVNALLIKRSSDFSSVPVGTLILFWMSRPRMAWIATLLVNIEKEKSMYVSLGASALLTEFILQGIGAVFIGRTMAFAVKNNYYRLNYLQYVPERNAALFMYAGALLWLVTIGFFYVYVIWNYLGLGSLFMMLITVVWKWVVVLSKGIA